MSHRAGQRGGRCGPLPWPGCWPWPPAGAARSAPPLSAQARAAAANPDLDPGSSLGGLAAPGFRLVGQFSQPVSLSRFRGKVVILAFLDSERTTVCPLTSVSMTDAKELLGAAGNRVQLLGFDANPEAAAVSGVMAYFRAHSMVKPVGFPHRTGRAAAGGVERLAEGLATDAA
jgi:hypothetical protein